MKKVVVVFGCGGHRAQANRFQEIFSKDGDVEFYAITDEGDPPQWAKDFLVLAHLRDKYTGKSLSFRSILKNLFLAYRFLRKHKIKNVVSFGPGVALFVALAGKLCNCSIIHFETWSKFYTPTITSKVMRRLTSHIFIQNIELKTSMPYAKYVGRF